MIGNNMSPRTTITKKKPTKCSIGKALNLLLVFVLALFAVSIFVSFNLTTSVRPPDSKVLIDDPRNLRTNPSKDAKLPTKQKISGGDEPDQVILEWIKNHPDKINGAHSSSSLSKLLATPLNYPPGSLPLSQLSTFQHCYTDPTVYSKHLGHMGGGSKRRAPYSKKHKLALVLVPKSGSSTGRYMMKVRNGSFESVCF